MSTRRVIPYQARAVQTHGADRSCGERQARNEVVAGPASAQRDTFGTSKMVQLRVKVVD